MANYIGNEPLAGEFKRLDSIESQFNGSLTSFNLLFNSLATSAGDASTLFVSLNGVIQEPIEAYTLTNGGSKIVFNSAPATGAECYIVQMGSVGGTATPSDASVTHGKFHTSVGAIVPSALGSAGQVLTVNPGATAATFADAGGGADLYAENYNGTSTKPSATGTNAIAIGREATSTSTNNVAIGGYAKATGSGAMAFGESAASGQTSLAMQIGQYQTVYGASGTQSIAIGVYNKASATEAIAIGRQSTASHNYSIAFGKDISSTAANQVSIGGSTQDVRISETYTLPKVDGTSGQVLTTNGSGVSSWATASGGGASSINGLTDGYFDTKNNIAFGNNTSSIYANIDLTATHGAKSNVAMGYNHFSYITSGQYNIAVGNNCLVFNETGSKNTAIGQNALQQANVARGTGDSNVGVGEFAGSYNSTGDSNTFVGHNTNTVIRGGNYQTAIGYNAKVGASGATALTNSRASGTDSLAAAIANNTTSYGASGTSSFAIGYQAKATGAYSFAIDYQSQATGIASRAIGYQAISSGTNSMALGRKANATGVYSYALGWSKSSTNGKFTYGSGQFSGLGDAQQGTFVLRSDTTDATAEAMTTDNSSADTTDQVVLPNNSCFGFTGTVIAREDSSATNDFAVWEIKGGAVRAGSASTTALGTYNINKISESTGATNWSIALSADTTNGAVAITVTGEASHNIRWVATVNTTEVIY